jgi:hypothetical protein
MDEKIYKSEEIQQVVKELGELLNEKGKYYKNNILKRDLKNITSVMENKWDRISACIANNEMPSINDLFDMAGYCMLLLVKLKI